MMSGDGCLYDNRVIACMAPLHLDMQIGHGLQQTVVIIPHVVVTDVMPIPGFVVVAGCSSECS